jgi:hypothetical protein
MAEVDTGLAALALTQAITVFHQFLPPLVDVRHSTMGDRTAVLDIRVGEMASVALSLGLGMVISMLASSHLPFIISAIASAGLVAIYEYALRCD